MAILVDPDKEQGVKFKKDSFFDENAAANYDPNTQSTVQPQNNTVVVGSPGERRSSNDILKDIFSYTPPKPTYDPNRPEEMKRLARNSAIAKGLNLVGDTFALAKGANVNKRQPDNKEYQFLNSAYGYIDKNNERMDEWNWRDFANKLRAGEMSLRQANQDKDFQAQQDYRNWLKEKQLSDSKESQARWATERADKLAQEKADNLRKDKIANAQIENYRTLASKRTGEENKPIKIQTSDGKVHELTPEQASYARDFTRANQEEMVKMFPQLFTKIPIKDEMGNLTGDYNYELAKGTKDDDLVRAALEYSGKSQEAAQNFNNYINSISRPQYNGPVREGQPAGQQTPVIDYSKLNY